MINFDENPSCNSCQSGIRPSICLNLSVLVDQNSAPSVGISPNNEFYCSASKVNLVQPFTPQDSSLQRRYPCTGRASQDFAVQSGPASRCGAAAGSPVHVGASRPRPAAIQNRLGVPQGHTLKWMNLWECDFGRLNA